MMTPVKALPINPMTQVLTPVKASSRNLKRKNHTIHILNSVKIPPRKKKRKKQIKINQAWSGIYV